MLSIFLRQSAASSDIPRAFEVCLRQNSDLSRSCKSASRVKAASSQAHDCWKSASRIEPTSCAVPEHPFEAPSKRQQNSDLSRMFWLVVFLGMGKRGAEEGNGRGESGEDEVGRRSNKAENYSLTQKKRSTVSILKINPDKRLWFRIASGAHTAFRTIKSPCSSMTASQIPTIDVKYHTCLQLDFIVARALILSWYLVRTEVRKQHRIPKQSIPIQFTTGIQNWTIAHLLYSVPVVVEETIYVITLPR